MMALINAQPESLGVQNLGVLVGVIAALVAAMVWMVKHTAGSAEKREDKLVDSLDKNTTMLGQLRDNSVEQTVHMKELRTSLGNHKRNVEMIPEIGRGVREIREKLDQE